MNRDLHAVWPAIAVPGSGAPATPPAVTPVTAPGGNGGRSVAPTVTAVTAVTDPRQGGERASAPARLLDDVEQLLARFVAFPSVHARTATVLWAAHTHALDSFEHTPRLAFLSPEPGSGKTRALEVLELLTPNPVHAVNTSAAYLFRRVADVDNRPTILFDEADTVFGPRASKDNEDVRGMLNAGHARGAVAGRCVVRGKTVDYEDLPAFCAVALAGLGDLPDTVMTRSIILRMRRRAPHERVEAFRKRQHGGEGEQLRDRLAEWASKVRPALADAWPDLPDGIEDRSADVWEPLLAVADAAGGAWPDRARAAAVAMVTEAAERPATLGVRLLGDLRVVFDQDDADVLFTETVLQRLIALDDSPWADLRGKELDSRGLASRLGEYQTEDGRRIASTTLRLGDRIAKGYRRADLHDAWQRYLPPSPRGAVTAVTAETDASADGEWPPSSSPRGSVTAVTAGTRVHRGRCAECREPMVVVEPGQTTHPACAGGAT